MKEKPFRVLTKRGNRINATPGLGWLLLVPAIALVALLYTFPRQLWWTIQDLWKLISK